MIRSKELLKAESQEHNLTPLVSVILPVFNCEKYIRDSVESILNQTYKNIELIIVDDGSTDKSIDVISNILDPRLKIFSQPNMGLAKTLNVLISKCSGEFIARQDADDISLPTRIEKQVKYLLRNYQCGLIGTWAKIYIENQDTGRVLKHPSLNHEMKYLLYFDNPLVHTSVMFRRSLTQSMKMYQHEKSLQPEDYELWTRMALKTKFANIPEFLVIYREVPTSISRSSNDPFPYLDDLVSMHIKRSTYGIVPLKWSKIFSNSYRGKEHDGFVLKRKFIIIYIGIILLLRERAYSRSFLGRIRRMLKS